MTQIIIDDIVLPTPRGDDVVSDETDDSIHMVEQEVKGDGMIIAQPTLEGLETPVVSLVVDPSTEDGPTTVNPTIFDAPLS